MCNQTNFEREQFTQIIGAAAIALAGLMYDQKGGTGKILDLAAPVIEGTEGRLYTIKESCNLLRISRSTLARRAKQYGIRPVKRLLPTVRYSDAALDKLRK